MDRIPKRTLNVGVNKTLYLFEQLIQNIMDVVNQAGVWVPLYIMTSEKNNEDTITFFEEHNCFGYDKNYVCIFRHSSTICTEILSQCHDDRSSLYMIAINK